MTIDEVIVVEGRDDTAAVKRAVDCETIETHGFGISSETWRRLDYAYDRKGLIILTDPDHAGDEIRKRLKERYPKSKEAFISRALSTKAGDIGVENASPADIREALGKARKEGYGHKGENDTKPWITMTILVEHGLSGFHGSSDKREKVADILGIGRCNASAMLKRVTGYGITQEEFDEALRTVESERD